MPTAESYNAGRQLRRPTGIRVMKDSEFKMRQVAAALFNINGCDATAEQIMKARHAVKFFNEGKPVAKILLLLRIKPVQKPDLIPWS